jgi:uncharacterized repeat protein (TIGR02543 family)
MGAQSRLFTSLASGSGKATAVVVCAVMLLAGCGGSGGSATDASTPVIRGDAAAAGASGTTVTAPGTPPAPTIVAGANRITVTVAPGTSGGTPTFHDVVTLHYDPATKTYTSPGRCTVSGASGSCEVTGLTPGKIRAMSMATNTAGSSIYGPYSAWAWVETVPGTPPAPTVVAGTAKVTATVAAGTSGGTPASYTVTAYTGTGMETVAGTCTVEGSSGYCEVTPLTAGSTYTVKAVAKNTAGDSGASDASSPVTLAAPLRTVTFNANGGENTMADQTANTLTPLKANDFTKTGFVFDGWSTTLNGDKAYGNGDNYSFGQNATLYARWAAVPSTVTTQAATVPGAPGLTALSRRSKTEVWVTFTAPSSTGGADITGYTVTATRNGVDITQSFPAEAGRVSVGPLTRYAVYTFTVRAVNSVGTSGPSNANTFRVDR